MVTAKEYIKELEDLVVTERYSEALAKLEIEGKELLESLPESSLHQKLLLASARIYYCNQLNHDALDCLDKLECFYPDIADNFEYNYLRCEVLLFEGKTDEVRKIVDASFEKAWSEEEKYWFKFNLGMTHFMSGNYVHSNCLFQACHDHAESSGNDYMLGCSSYMLGYVAFQRCFFSVSETNFKRALKSFEIVGKNNEIGNTYKMFGILTYRTGRYAEARENLTQAIKCYERCPNSIGIIDSKTALGRVCIFLGQYRKAEKLLLESHEKATACGYKRGVAVSAEFLGEVYYNLGTYEESLRYLRLDEEIARDIAPHGDVAVEVYRRLGDVYLALDRIDEAEEALARALDLSERLHDRYEQGAVLRAYGMVAAVRDDIDLARSFFNEAIVTLKIIKESFELARTYQISSEIYERWSESTDLPSELRDGLISEAREHALEAMHLYSSHELDGRARECERLLGRMDSKLRSTGRGPESRCIRFNSEWLCEGILVARSRHMLDVVERVRRVAPSKIPVSICGETGTGKELVARLLHKLSGRGGGPFVAVNCAAVPQSVFESEFFGHKRGSFTGAFEDSVGLIEEATGGTLFLDDISELSIDQQAKLLRVFQEGRIRRVGESIERTVDVRIVSASNVDIQDMLVSGKLREDLYYRIAGEVVHLEPLRKREDDVSALFAYYMDRDGEGVMVEDGLLELLMCYHWPGNVRELVNLTGTLSLLKGRGLVRVHDLPLLIRNYFRYEPEIGICSVAGDIRKLKNSGGSLGDNDPEGIRQLIYSSLRKCGGNRSAAARELGISRSTLYRRMEELGIG